MAVSLERRCHVCGAAAQAGTGQCSACQFDLDDGEAYAARISPADTPRPVAQRILTSLNGITSAEELGRRVPLLDPAIPGVEDMATRVLRVRDEQHSGRFPNLAAVAQVPDLSAGRFAELVTALGTVSQRYEPVFLSDAPGRRGFSASRSELDFRYEVLTGPAVGARGTITAMRCTCCTSDRTAIFVEEQQRFESRLDVTKAIFDGQDDLAVVNVEMDGDLAPYDYMYPVRQDAGRFEFPAWMHLNNNMVLHVQLKVGGPTLKLVSRKVTEQVGLILAWPPYGMRLHSLEPSDYYLADDPSGPPVLRVLDGTTFLTGPSNFLNHSADILRYGTTTDPNTGQLRSVRLHWRPVPPDSKYERQADYYHVYRAVGSASGDAAWQNVSGPVHTAQWTDNEVPSDSTVLMYRVVAVWVTSLGRTFESFPGQSVRVEPSASPFRWGAPSGAG